MTITGVDLTQGNIQTKPFSPVDIFTTTMVDLPPAADHEGALVYVAGTGLLLSDGTNWVAVLANNGVPDISTISSGAVYQQFSVSLINDSGVIKHRFGAANHISQAISGSADCLSAVRNAALGTYVTTPNGPNSSTDLSGGAKISNLGSGPIYVLFLDTDDPADDNTDGMLATITVNDTGNAVAVRTFFDGTAINGVSKLRLSLRFHHPETGAILNINSSLIPSGKEIRVALAGFMGPLTS